MATLGERLEKHCLDNADSLDGLDRIDFFIAGYKLAIADAAKVIRRIMHTLPGVALTDSVAEAIEKLAMSSPAREPSTQPRSEP